MCFRGVRRRHSKVPASISVEIDEDELIPDINKPKTTTTSENVNNISPWSNKLSSLSVSSKYETRLKIDAAVIIQIAPRHE